VVAALQVVLLLLVVLLRCGTGAASVVAVGRRGFRGTGAGGQLLDAVQ